MTKPATLIREKEILRRLPIQHTYFWQKVVRDPRFPPAVKLGPRITAWDEAKVDAYIRTLMDEAESA